MGAALAVRFRVVRQLSVAGMQQRNRNRPSSLLPSTFFFCLPLSLPLFFILPPPFCFCCYYYRYYFWTATASRSYKPGWKVESTDAGTGERERAERRATRTQSGRGGGRGKEEKDICVYRHASSFVRPLEKPKATAGCVTLAALPMGASERQRLFHSLNSNGRYPNTFANASPKRFVRTGHECRSDFFDLSRWRSRAHYSHNIPHYQSARIHYRCPLPKKSLYGLSRGPGCPSALPFYP